MKMEKAILTHILVVALVESSPQRAYLSRSEPGNVANVRHVSPRKRKRKTQPLLGTR